LNLNTVNYFNNGLFEELRKLRVGGYDMKSLTDFPVLNSGIIPYKGDPNGSTTASLYAGTAANFNDSLSGAEQMLYSQWDNISRGSFRNALRDTDMYGNVTGLFGANFASLLRDRGLRPNISSNESSGQVLRAGNAPNNLIVANPQYDSANITRNQGRSNYHSMQVQISMRPVRGLSMQGTWTWSRNLTRGSVIDDREDSPYYWDTGYGLSGQHRLHTINFYGSYEMPLGARGFLFRDASGYFKKAIEGWQVSWISQLSSGTGMSLTGLGSVWGTSRVVQVGEFDAKDVILKWHPYGTETNRSKHGTYFNKEYTWVTDPQCQDSGLVSQTATNFSGARMTATCGTPVFWSTSVPQALAEVMRDDQGNVVERKIIFRNAIPGEIGNRNGSNIIYGPGTWSLDMAMSKSIEFMEGKRFEIRLDAQNILNHARPSFGDSSANNAAQYGRVSGVANPNAALNDMWAGSYAFGYTNLKAGHRTFQAKLRLSF
jgi:hypothetical protein